MYRVLKFSVMFLMVFSLTACSVIMASRNTGYTPQKLAHCKTKHCISKAGLKLLEQRRNAEGKIYYEKYYALFPTGSKARAAMHGLFDMTTLGMWEIVGSPMEAIKGKKKGYVVVVTYEPDEKTVNHMVFKFN